MKSVGDVTWGGPTSFGPIKMMVGLDFSDQAEKGLGSF